MCLGGGQEGQGGGGGGKGQRGETNARFPLGILATDLQTDSF